MKRQKIRKMFLMVSLLLFPVTLYYFSPALIINAGLNGIVNGSFVVFVFLFLLSVPFGRLFCAYLCPAGGLQECVFAVNERNPRQGWRNTIKFVIWGIWLAIVIGCYFYGGKIEKTDFFFETENGISVSSVQSYIIYYGIICLVLIPSLLGGKRTFCHYFCWMAPFMILGTKLRRFFYLPGLHIKVNEKNKCVSCGRCSKICPMGIDVMDKMKYKRINHPECIQCGECVDHCPKNVLAYGMAGRREAFDGKRKED